MGLALQLSTLLRLPDFAGSFTTMAVEMMAAKGAALALYQDSKLETVVLRTSSGETVQDPALLQGFSRAVAQIIQQRSEPIISLEAADALAIFADDGHGVENLYVSAIAGARRVN